MKCNPSAPETRRGRGHLQLPCGAAREPYISESQGGHFFANEADRWKSETLLPQSLSDLFPDVSLKGKIKEIKQICICGLLFLRLTLFEVI